MDIQSLVGFTLEACRFSKSSYTFEFSGQNQGRHATVLLITAFSVAFGDGAGVDVCADFSRYAWPLLERELTRVDTNAETFEARFEFGADDHAFVVWSDGPPADNLLLMRNSESGEWCTVL